MDFKEEKTMSTLEKTIDLLNVLPESQIEMIYSFVQFLSSQQMEEKPFDMESLDDIFGNIVGTVPDTGKTLEEYREERIRERYETAN
ncbi:MAG: hypothetical protein NC416_09385 [Eubacterium sp.]|nr:hypothetical protein [Eubacterium sp.]